MAEAFAIVSIITNIITLIDFSVEVYDRAKGFSDVKDIPKAFRNIRNVLSSVSDSLQQTRKEIDSGEIDESACKSLKPSIQGCAEVVSELSELFKKVLPADGASRWTRGFKALSSVRADKKVENLNKKMMQYVNVLTLYHVSKRMKKEQPARKPLFMVRYRKEEGFIGRQEVMVEISKRFEAKDQKVAIAGIGGVGKSRIAIEYCYQYHAENSDAHVLWVHGGSRARFEAAYKDIASTLKIPRYDEPQVDTLVLVSDWLSRKENGSWLMILDNADNAKIWDGSGSTSLETPDPLVKYLPRGEHGSMMITTRNMQLGKVLSRVGRPKKPIEIFSFDSNDAIALLRSRIPEHQVITEQDAKTLTEALDYLPLAITQAAAYLDLNDDMPVAKYIELIESTDLLSKENYDDTRDPDIQNSVFKTWKISFDQISEECPRAGEILSLMAMFDRQGIPVYLITNKHVKEDDLLLFEAISKLKAFSLIDEESKGKTYSMHRVVHLSVQWYLRNQGSLMNWQEKAVESLSYCFPNHGDVYENWGTIEPLDPHAQIILSYSFRKESSLLQQARVNHSLAGYQSQYGQYALAIQYASNSLHVREKILGPENSDTLYTMGDLAWYLKDDRNFEEAESIARQALDISTKLYSGESSHGSESLRRHDANVQARNLNILSSILTQSRQFEEAEVLLNQSIEIHTAIEGLESNDTLGAIQNLGNLYNSQGKYVKAEEILRMVIEGITKYHNGDKPFIITAMRNLAIALSSQQKFEEEEVLTREIVSLKKEVFGPEHESTLYSMASLVKSLYNLHKDNEAKEIAEECLESCMAVLGPAHGTTIWAQDWANFLNSCLSQQEDSQISGVQEIDSTDMMNDEDEGSDSSNLKAREEDPRWNEDGSVVLKDDKRSGMKTEIQESVGTLTISD